MTLTVEDGSNVSGADSFITLAECDAYHMARGNSSWASDDAKEPAIRRATANLSSKIWSGKPTNARSQALAWPRTGVVDANGYTIAEDEIPQEIKDAACELALRELVSPNSTNPDFVASEKIKREKIDVIETEYADTANNSQSITPVFQVVDALIGQFLSNGGSKTVYLARA